jgi:hypothetical protein
MQFVLLDLLAGQSGVLERAAEEFFKYGVVGTVAVVEAVILFFVGRLVLSGLKQDKDRLLEENKKLREEHAAEKAEAIKMMLEMNATLGRAARMLPRKKDEP